MLLKFSSEPMFATALMNGLVRHVDVFHLNKKMAGFLSNENK